MNRGLAAFSASFTQTFKRVVHKCCCCASGDSVTNAQNFTGQRECNFTGQRECNFHQSCQPQVIAVKHLQAV